MKNLDIQITKAALKSFRVELCEGKPEISATIALLTDGGKQITDYTISTNSWQENNKFEVPISVLPQIGLIARELEAIVTKHCKDSQLALSTGKVDEPLNLDNIPF